MKAVSVFLFSAILAMAADLRVGIVGTDTSHVIAFVKILNDPKNPDYQPGAKIVAAYKGGSSDLESSRTRVEGYAKELHDKWGVEIVPDIKTLCEKVDAILLESVDGRIHLAQAGGNPGVNEMEFRSLDQAFAAVAVPGVEAASDKKALQQGEIALYGGPGMAEVL